MQTSEEIIAKKMRELLKEQAKFILNDKSTPDMGRKFQMCAIERLLENIEKGKENE